MSKQFDINQYHKEASKKDATRGSTIKAITCADGFTVSVQASEYHYCSPRESGAWPYASFEVGYPSAKERTLMKYAEDKSRPTDTVYGWVPASVIEKIIIKHGGIKP